jgi:drug/metabolite transporter, DME family
LNPTAKTKPTNLGFFYILVATILWSLSGFFTQLPQLTVWSSDHRGINIAFWRAFFALMVLIPFVRRVTWNVRMLPMVGCFALMTLSFLTALVVGSPANTIWLQYLAPAWVMLGSVLIYRDRPTSRDKVMLGFCIVGVLSILVLEFLMGTKDPNHRWWAPILAIVSGITYAGVILSIRSMPNEDPAWLISLNHFGTMCVVGPILLYLGFQWPSAGAWWILACLGCFQMGLPYLLFAHGLRTIPSYVASVISLLEPIILPLWVLIARWGDPGYVAPGWWTWMGASLIVVGILSRYLPLPNRCPTLEEQT